MRTISRTLFPLLLFAPFALPSCVLAQITNVTNQTSTPIQGAGHDYIKMLNETVNPANGTVSLRIQVPTPPGRQLSLPFAFGYDSGPVEHLLNMGPSGGVFWGSNSAYLAQGGWSYSIPMLSTSLQKRTVTPKGICTYYSFFVFQDATGGPHHLGVAIDWNDLPGGCTNANPAPPVQVFNAGDDYYQASLTTTSAPLLVASADGTIYSIPYTSRAHGSGSLYGAYSILPTSIEDRNGNIINVTDNGSGSVSMKDTLGRTMLSTSSFGSTDSVAVSGLTNPYTVTWEGNTASYSVGASLIWSDGVGCNSIPSVTSAPNVVKQIQLPNNKLYVFSYDPTYGLLNKITYPGGGFVSYSYAMNSLSEFVSLADQNGSSDGCYWHYGVPAVSQRSVSFDGVHIALQQNFSYSVVWAADGTTWTSKTTTVTTTDNITGLSYTTNYMYTPFNAPTDPNDWSTLQSQIPLEQSVVTKNSSGTVLRTFNKSWIDQYELKSQQTVLENNLTSETDYTYGSGAQIIEQDDYDFGSGARGNLIRKTVNAYQAFAATPIYPSAASIFDRPCKSIVYDSSGTNRVAETDYLYDGGATVCGTAGTPSVSGVNNLPTGTHDEANYGQTSTAPRGNLTNVIKQCFQGSQACASGNPATTSTFDETGQVTSITDPNNHTTQLSYADNYTVLSGGTNVTYSSSANTNAYLTKITNPLSQTQNFTYDFNNGQLTVAKDQNNLITSYVYNDSLARPTLSTHPDGGTTTVAYDDTALTITTSKQINTSQTLTSVALSDGLGHVKQTQLTSDPQGTVYTDTTFDGLGRVYTLSNPYRTGSDPTTSSGTTSYFYDALGRKCLEVPPDGTLPSGGVCPTTQPANTIFTAYSGNTITVTDQTAKSRKSATDGLGRLIQIFEDPAGLNYETDYALDALGNLLAVNQKGGSTNSALWRTRTFTYDSLSRLLTSTNPETGTITYKYDADSNCASPSTFLSLLVSKTDARGIRTCAQYDAINRETVLNYSNGDPTITTTYDQSACLGLSACQNIGQRTSATDAAGSESWAYQVDATNHRSVHVNQRTTNSITKTSTYYLDLAGNVTQAVYPTGRVVNYTFDAANRPKTAADGSNGITYATDFQSVPTGCLTGAVCYTPQDTYYALSIGQATGFTGLNLTNTYNNRLQPNEFKSSSTGGNAIDITYGFVDPSTNHNSGHVYSITNNIDATRSQTFTYDQLNRITGALTTSTHATSPTHCWGEAYTVDAWGNLNVIAPTNNSAYTGCTEESGFSTTADGNNHVPIFGYDSSGNTQSDGTFSYTWDAESQLKSATNNGNTTNYTYDGDGRRVSKSNGKLYWYGSGGDILAETDASGNTQNEYIFFGGKRIAVVPLGGKPMYYVEDMLGTSRVLTSGSPTRIQSSGGTNIWKYYYTGLCPGVSGTTYTISVLIKNQGTASMQIAGNIAYGPVIAPGTTQQVSFTEVGNGVSCIQFGLLTLNTSDPMDVLAYAPVISVGGTNLIPTANQDFSGWSAYQGASVTITQGQPPQVVYDADFYPYGGERAYVSIFPQNYKFEGKERDTETGNDDFGARYYSNRFGRWLTADWSAVPAPVPYANLTNPQTLNLYSMVSDDPESFADLDGHQSADAPPTPPACSTACTDPSTTNDKQPGSTEAAQRKDPELEAIIAAGKEVLNEIIVPLVNLLPAGDNRPPNKAEPPKTPEFEGSNDLQKASMKLAGVALFFVPGAGEEKTGAKAAHIVEEIFKNPKALKEFLTEAHANQLADTLKGLGWDIKKLGEGTHAGQGVRALERNAAGKLTDRSIMWHPGGGRHGPSPYYKVSSSKGGTVRVGPQFP